jgi:hypothetical protein
MIARLEAADDFALEPCDAIPENRGACLSFKPFDIGKLGQGIRTFEALKLVCPVLGHDVQSETSALIDQLV